jgi:hypothetical protein
MNNVIENEAKSRAISEIINLIGWDPATDGAYEAAERVYEGGFRKFEIVEDEAPGKLDRIRVLAFDPSALIYSDAPGYIQDIRDVLDDEVTNV